MTDTQNKDAGSLEETIENITPEQGMWGVNSDGAPIVHDLENYIDEFTTRYTRELPFQEIVHNYLGISSMGRMKLSMGKAFLPSWYKKRKDSMIRDYAVKIRYDLEQALALRQELITLQEAEAKLRGEASGVLGAEEKKAQAFDEYGRALSAKEDAVSRAKREYDALVQETMAQADANTNAIVAQTDPAAIVREKLKQHLLAFSIFRVNDRGELQFDEQQVMRKLEDMFLQEIVSGIERQGDTGFLTKTKRTYEGVMAYWAELDDIDELPETDWVESAIYARTQGHRIPRYPYLITGKPKQQNARSSLEAAIALDTSGSMKDNGRFSAAKKTVLATHALLRKLNPHNNTYLARYTNSLHPTNTTELYKMQEPDGGTATELALNWLADTLSPTGLPGLAYLVTDGLPNDLPVAIEAAKRFQEHPQLLLRIFLIDGDKDSLENIRQMGRAAGPKTKVIPVESRGLAAGVIKDISQAIGQMYEIEKF